MKLLYCSNNLPAVDTILNPIMVNFDTVRAGYCEQIFADLYDPEEPSTQYKAGNPSLCKIVGGVVSFKTDEDFLPVRKEEAKGSLGMLVGKLLTKGCLTSVNSLEGTPIRMDADRVAISNIFSLMTLMQEDQLGTTLVRDFYNGFHELSFEQVKKVYTDLVRFNADAYKAKWEVERYLEEAKTCAEVDVLLNAYLGEG